MTYHCMSHDFNNIKYILGILKSKLKQHNASSKKLNSPNLWNTSSILYAKEDFK